MLDSRKGLKMPRASGLLVALIAAWMLLAFSSVCSAAVEVVIGDVTANPGQTVQIPISITAEAGTLSGFEVTVSVAKSAGAPDLQNPTWSTGDLATGWSISKALDPWQLVMLHLGGGTVTGPGEMAVLSVTIDPSTPRDSVYTLTTSFNRLADGETNERDNVEVEAGQITVPNSPPVAVAPTPEPVTDEDTSVDIVLSGTDADGDDLTFEVVTQPANGTLSGTAPNLTYTPNADFNGTASFTFTVTDGVVTSDPATVNITVNPVNDDPVIGLPASPVSGSEGQLITFTVTSTDVDGDTPTYSSDNLPEGATLDPATGVFSWTPSFTQAGDVDVSFTVSDGQGGSDTGTVTISVANVNRPPTATAQQVITSVNRAVAITLTGEDLDGDPLTFEVATPPANGTLSGTAPNLTYTPDTDFVGTDSFTFTASDGTDSSESAVVQITVLENAAPVAQDQTVTTAEDTPVDITLTATDIEGDELTFEVVTPPANGTLSGTAPNLTYTPNDDFNGTDSFTFTASDGVSTSDPATVTINVSATNDPPRVTDDVLTILEDQSGTISVLANDVDPEGATLTITGITQPEHGTARILGEGAIEYVPNPNYNGSDRFSYTVSDGSDSATGFVFIEVQPVDDDPEAQSQSVTTPEDTPVEITLVGSDPDGDEVTFIVESQPTSGTLSGSGADLVYTPNPDFNGTDTFTFLVRAGETDSPVATVTITVTPVNDPPVAPGAMVNAVAGTPLDITLPGTDVDGDPLTFEVVTGPTNGTLSAVTGNQVTYTANAGFTGADSFTYRVSDGTEQSAEGTIQITVAAEVTEGSLGLGSAVVDPDTVVEIPVTGTGLEGLVGFTLEIEPVSPEGAPALELVEVVRGAGLTAGDITTQTTNGVVSVALTGAVPTAEGGPLAVLRLQVPANAPQGGIYTLNLRSTTATLSEADGTTRTVVTARTGGTVTIRQTTVPGDATGDGRVDITDVLLIVRFMLNLQEPTPAQLAAADLTGDGVIDIADVIRAVRLALGLPLS